jgi:hypothetical protein
LRFRTLLGHRLSNSVAAAAFPSRCRRLPLSPPHPPPVFPLRRGEELLFEEITPEIHLGAICSAAPIGGHRCAPALLQSAIGAAPSGRRRCSNGLPAPRQRCLHRPQALQRAETRGATNVGHRCSQRPAALLQTTKQASSPATTTMRGDGAANELLPEGGDAGRGGLCRQFLHH